MYWHVQSMGRAWSSIALAMYTNVQHAAPVSSIVLHGHPMVDNGLACSSMGKPWSSIGKPWPSMVKPWSAILHNGQACSPIV